MQFEGTVCGTPIQFRANEKQSNATLGGIVKLIYMNGSWELRGLTAGHATFACLGEEPLDESMLSSEIYDGDDSSMDEEGSQCSSSNSDLTFFLDDGEVGSETSSQYFQKNPWAVQNPLVLGEAVIARSIRSVLKGEPVEDGGFFDWALTSLSEFKINQLPVPTYPQDSGLIFKVRRFTYNATDLSSEPVMIMCGSGGIKHGRLMPEPSRILISPGPQFVTAYMIELSDRAFLSDGDSGSWVISVRSHDLLGHIVATDILGTGYIVPAEDIFDDIVQNSLAVAVVLPTVDDIYSKTGVRNEHSRQSDLLSFHSRLNWPGNTVLAKERNGTQGGKSTDSQSRQRLSSTSIAQRAMDAALLGNSSDEEGEVVDGGVRGLTHNHTRTDVDV